MNSIFSVFSPQQWLVLQALGRYRFLTVDQMVYLGLSQSPNALRDKTITVLRHLGCVHSEKIGPFLPDVHHLTQQGWETLNEVEDGAYFAIPSSKRQPFSALFAAHRFAQVDFHLCLARWVDQRPDLELILERQDFVRQPRPVTELNPIGGGRSIIPDGTFAVQTMEGQQAVFLVEIHRSTQSKAATEQLTRYFDVIKHRTVQKKYRLSASPIICSVHMSDAVLASVKRRLIDDQAFEAFQHNFVFRPGADLREKFADGWHFADDSPAFPFPLKP